MKQGAQSENGRVQFREITADTVREICALSVQENQNLFVTANATSIAEAYFSKHAWLRAIYSDSVPVGFIMLDERPEEAEYFLWRFMIDKRFQGRGIGRQAIQLLLTHVKSRPNSSELFTSVVQAKGGPEAFYKNMGFELTGEYEEGEALMRITL